MAAALTTFARYVRPDVLGCPEIVILDAILRAGIEFCKRTKVSKENIAITTIINTAAYPLVTASPTNTIVDEVLNVNRDLYSTLRPSSVFEIEAMRYDIQTGLSYYYYLDNNNQLVLGLVPNGIETLTAVVKTIPTDNATTLPDVLARRYKLEIAAGAKAMLMLDAGKQWSNPKYAAVHQGIFNAGIDLANVREARGNSMKPLRTRTYQF